MGLAIRSNVAQVNRDLDRFAAAVTTALPRAVNKLKDQAETAGLRKASEIYGLGPRTIEKYLTIKLATTEDLEASITARGLGFPLSAFQPRPTAHGVSVLIKGRRVIVPHSFMATLSSGHAGVFARGSYGGKGSRFIPTGEAFGRFLFGRKRLPINELFTFSPPDVMANADVVDAMQAKVEEQTPIILGHEIDFALGKR